MLALLRPSWRYTVDSDKFNQNLGCVLFQDETKRPTKPVASIFKSLNKAEQEYDATHRECLVSIWEFFWWECIRRIANYNLHASRRAALHPKYDINSWKTRQLTFKAVRIPIWCHATTLYPTVAAHALSRSPTTRNDRTLLVDSRPVLKILYNDSSDGISCVLTIINAKYDLHIKHVIADKTDSFTLRWDDNDKLEWTDYKQTPALARVLQITDSPDLDCSVNTADFITN